MSRFGILVNQPLYAVLRIPTVAAKDDLTGRTKDFHCVPNQFGRHFQLALLLCIHAIGYGERKVFSRFPERNGEHETDKAMSVEIVRAVMRGVVVKFAPIFKLFDLCGEHSGIK